MSRQQAEPETPVGRKDPMALLREVRAILSTVYHDVNNPLAIISGNAQFLMELSHAADLDEDLVQPIRDIEEASRRVAEQLRDLVRLKEEITKYLSEGEGG